MQSNYRYMHTHLYGQSHPTRHQRNTLTSISPVPAAPEPRRIEFTRVAAHDGSTEIQDYNPGVYDAVSADAVRAHTAQQLQLAILNSLQSDIYFLLADVVSINGVDDAYLSFLHSYFEAAHISEQKNTPLSILPLLSCVAVGGEPSDALPAAAAWRALHLAAKLLDDVEDGDASLLNSGLGAPSAINLATGLFSAAGLALLRLSPAVQQRVLSKFHSTILLMSSGQHTDLSGSAYTFDDYMGIIAAKSGRFFSLATTSGAWCGTSNDEHVALLDIFGFNVGIFLQIADDYLDWHNPDSIELSTGKATLPVCFIRSVGTESQVEDIERLVVHARSGGQAALQASVEARRLASEAGADAYMLAEMIRHKVRAMSSLEDLEQQGLEINALRDWFLAISAFISS